MQRVSVRETGGGGGARALRQSGGERGKGTEDPAGQTEGTVKNFINSIKLNIFWKPETEIQGK